MKIYLYLIVFKMMAYCTSNCSAGEYTFFGNLNSEIESVKFIDGSTIQISEEGIKNLFFFGTDRKLIANKTISNDHVFIAAAYPNRENAEIAFAKSSCGGTMCTWENFYMIIPEKNYPRIYEFTPSNRDFQIKIKTDQKEIVHVYPKNLLGYDNIGTLGDVNTFTFKFIDGIGFVKNKGKKNLLHLVGFHPEEFLGDKNLRKPLVLNMKSEDFRDLRDHMKVAAPSEIKEYQYVVFNGCMPHSCDSFSGTIVIDSISGSIWTVWGSTDGKDIKFGNSAPWTNFSIDTLFNYSNLINALNNKNPKFSSDARKQILKFPKKFK